jgi:hypothetical protein
MNSVHMPTAVAGEGRRIGPCACHSGACRTVCVQRVALSRG